MTVVTSKTNAKHVYYQCEFPNCSKRYPKPCLLVEHERTHTGEAPYQCPLCSKSFRRERNLVQHGLVHQNTLDITFPCKVLGCSKVYKTKRLLRRHALIHLKEKPFKCTEPGCLAAFIKEPQLRRHLCSHTGGSMYPCTWPNCKASFPTPSKLKRHFACHANPKSYVCPTCSINFTTYLGLHQHLRTLHGHRLRLVCPQCERVFHSESGVRRHVCSLNECTQCQKRFSKRSNYLTHMKTVHENSNTVSLPLTRMPSETRKRPRTSTIDLFTSPKVLQSVTGFDLRRTFSCTQCSRTYQRQYDLDRHLRSSHPIEEVTTKHKRISLADTYLASCSHPSTTLPLENKPTEALN